MKEVKMWTKIKQLVDENRFGEALVEIAEEFDELSERICNLEKLSHNSCDKDYDFEISNLDDKIEELKDQLKNIEKKL